ncbi:hypothetical protein [Pseudoxanthomonas sp. X-1]|uniref:hypothetical protein n=1 Tax=Pseudoxanthomonas sp. X-1 TaxID=2571115 RepID=UPI00110A7A0E|nr:hypothetical protein [Pseudoxanthomonas sp. X-1]TMN18495.1 hypothetical protein FF950_14540 [Pseudoxanthomonas sp. X-1]UAY76001.1 hypothetical protein LAJ50_07125 [Pseudoxanthomonas sp. X-1]
MSSQLEHEAMAFLASLVKALDGAFISSWQSTAEWQTQLDEARDFLARSAEYAALNGETA